MDTLSLLSDRVRKIKAALLQSEVTLSCERLKYLMESYRETDGQNPVLRRARAFEKILNNRTIYIDDNPIVGTLTEYQLGVQPFVENSCDWMKGADSFRTALGKGTISEDDAKLLLETVNFWKGRDTFSRSVEAWSQKHPTVSYQELQDAGIMVDTAHTPMGRCCPDYGKVLKIGLTGIIKEARQKLNSLPLCSLESYRQTEFLNAVIITCEAVIAFAQRYGALAEEMAQKETDDRRKKELNRIAATCYHVPANPARDFYEAVQSFWFIQLAVSIEHLGPGICPGRFSQYMYPFYQKDKELGKLTEEETLELLELLFLKFVTLIRFLPGAVVEQNQGNMFQNISLGGLTPSGEDATNEMDYLVLEAQKRVRSIQPTLSILYHDRLPEELLLKAAELVSTGIGMPAFFNNDLNIQGLIEHGASLEDARNYSIIGCVEAGFSHSANTMHGGALNLPKMLELALNNGKDMLSGKQIGPQTGDPLKFRSYSELHEAIKEQLQYFMPLRIDFQYTVNALNAEFLPLPFNSALVDDCIATGKSMGQGGARYSMDGCGPVGVIDLADSLAAINKFVFEEKSLSMAELIEALRSNFDGKEELHHRLKKAPKYGNGGDYVERIAREWYDIFYDEHQKFHDYLGGRARPFALSVSYHPVLGSKTAALPSGREARESLADGTVSPCAGCDQEGPTAVLGSASRIIDTTKYASSLLNMKFHPSSLQTAKGQKQLVALVRTYMHLGGNHVQWNVVSADTLKDAQLNPQNHRDLIIRVAGFSAFFIQLDTRLQNEIIKRTEFTF